eukprot:COSAG02_NODE_1071_length_14802_cov_5.546419_10_plen_31_part_01
MGKDCGLWGGLYIVLFFGGGVASFLLCETPV